MGEFHDAVSTLLQAFAHGISIIKTQRGRRKKEKVPIDSSRKIAESHLSKSLKKNRKDVKNAYERDVALLGPGFAVGDEEAHSSLSSILLRLNAGFVSIIERFTRGKSTPADYQALLNLSNASRIEAMKTFEQLSKRLSHSSLALVPTNQTHEKHRRKRKSKKGASSVGDLKRSGTKSAPELAATPLGYASTEGWVRPKLGRKFSSDSRSSGSTSPKRSSPKTHSTDPSICKPPSPPKALPAPLPASPVPQLRAPPTTQIKTQPTSKMRVSPPFSRTRPVNRKSIMSFASDSTKLGEIPEHKWMTPGMFEAPNPSFPITTFYPIEPYQEPEKQRSRFMRLFRRSGN